MTIQDLMYDSLGDLEYAGSLTDRLFEFFKDSGAVSNNLVNAEFEWLGVLGYTGLTLQDRRVARIKSLGYTDLSGWTAAFDNTLLYSHRNLFLNGEQGVWYDPSDLSTLFQDSAGTIPVTAAGQPVGKILDKSGRGNHATQITAGARPILRQTPVLGSELLTNPDFTSGLTGWTVIDTAPGTTVASGNAAVMSNNSTGTARLRQQATVVAGRTYEVGVTVSGFSGTTALCSLAIGNSASGDTTYASVSIGANARYNRFITVTGTTLGLAFIVQAGAATTITVDDVTVKEVLSYRTDQNYLEFDGVDDFLVTQSINFTTTDKMTVVAGVRKMSDAAAGVLVELSAASFSNNGSFAVIAPDTAARYYSFLEKGSAASVRADATNAAFAAPNTAVLSGVGLISEDICKLRVNGAQVAESVVDQGAGNYGNYPLYIGRRGGTSLPFNGRLYGLVVRGAASTVAQIIAAEREMARRTGVTL